jgi:hypothetical protein
VGEGLHPDRDIFAGENTIMFGSVAVPSVGQSKNPFAPEFTATPSASRCPILKLSQCDTD